MCVKSGLEAVDTGCFDHIVGKAVLVCSNSFREGQPQFLPGEGHEDFLAVTPCLRVYCHCDLVDATW